MLSINVGSHQSIQVSVVAPSKIYFYKQFTREFSHREKSQQAQPKVRLCNRSNCKTQEPHLRLYRPQSAWQFRARTKKFYLFTKNTIPCSEVCKVGLQKTRRFLEQCSLNRPDQCMDIMHSTMCGEDQTWHVNPNISAVAVGD